MPQPAITLTAGAVTLTLDPDLYWSDEFAWAAVEQSIARSLTGALLIDVATRIGGRPITLQPSADNAAWMPSATVRQLQAWEADPALVLTLDLRGTTYDVVFRRDNGAPIEARPVEFQADPLPGDPGDWYLVTLRLLEV